MQVNQTLFMNSNSNVSNFIEELKSLDKEECLLNLQQIELAFKKGKLLLQLKKVTPHGAFLPLLKENGININERTAQRFMQLSINEEFIKKTTSLSDLTISKALSLIKKGITKEKAADTLIIESQFSIKTDFDIAIQKYSLTIRIDPKDIELLKVRKNQGILLKAIFESITKSRVANTLKEVNQN